MTAIHPSPEQVAAFPHLSRGEKLELLSDMKFELELQSSRGKIGLDQVETSMASINRAIARVRGRTPARRKNAYGKNQSAATQTTYS